MSGGATFTQTHFQWRYDNGNETGGSYIYPIDTTPPLLFGVKYRLRIAISCAGGSGNYPPYLYVSRNGGAYTIIDASNVYVRMISSDYVSNYASTTQQISTGTFHAGSTITDYGSYTQSMSSGEVTEIEFCLSIKNAGAGKSGGDDLLFRLYKGGAAPLEFYSITPHAIIYTNKTTII